MGNILTEPRQENKKKKKVLVQSKPKLDGCRLKSKKRHILPLLFPVTRGKDIIKDG